MRTLPFSNVDVLLRQHPGVSPADHSARLLHKSRGIMCFEHTQVMAAALDRMGYPVEHRLGRVHGPINTRTHAALLVTHANRRYLLGPASASASRALELADLAERKEALGTYRISRQDLGRVG